MFKSIFKFIDSLFPYKISGENNKIYIVIKGVRKELRRKINGLNIELSGRNNLIEIHLPIKFNQANINMEGENASFIMMPTTSIVEKASIHIESYGHLFIDQESRLNRPNLNIIINNNEHNKPHKLIIGKNAQVGKDITIRTSDGHSIFNKNEKIPFNEPQDIIIGDNVWLGERVMILKGARIPSNSIVGACSLVNKKFEEENIILAGNPAKIVKRNITWVRQPYGTYMNKENKIITNTMKNSESFKKIILKKIKRKYEKLIFESFF